MSNHLIDALLGHQPGDAPFLVHADGDVLSYARLRALVAGTAQSLRAHGVTPGDRVLCKIEKSSSGLVLYLATVAAGAIFVPLNPAYTDAELAYFIADAEPALLVMDIPGDHGVPSCTPDALVAEGAWDAPAPCGPDDLAGILYTSGTTGRSKGAMMSHENLLSNARALTDLWQFTAQDRLLHALPIFHTHGLFVATNVTLTAGAAMAFLPRFDIDAVARTLPDCTTMMGVPTFYTRMLEDPRFTRETMAHMRLVISGSAPLLSETHDQFAAMTGHAILERYGMTETNMITSNPYTGERRAGTVGRALPGVEVRISDPDDQGIGSIELTGPNVTKGYWRNAEKTAESFAPDGWFITGDLGHFEDGYLVIVGRAKDLVISGGYNIYPKEVELVIDALPGIRESAVFGLPDADLGERVAAAVVLDAPGTTDADAIRDALKDQLARFKTPREIVFLDALPRNAMGKVQKNELRANGSA